MSHVLHVRQEWPATDQFPVYVVEWDRASTYGTAAAARDEWLRRTRVGASPITRHGDAYAYTDANGCVNTLRWTDPEPAQGVLL